MPVYSVPTQQQQQQALVQAQPSAQYSQSGAARPAVQQPPQYQQQQQQPQPPQYQQPPQQQLQPPQQPSYQQPPQYQQPPTIQQPQQQQQQPPYQQQQAQPSQNASTGFNISGPPAIDHMMAELRAILKNKLQAKIDDAERTSSNILETLMAETKTLEGNQERLQEILARLNADLLKRQRQLADLQIVHDKRSELSRKSLDLGNLNGGKGTGVAFDLQDVIRVESVHAEQIMDCDFTDMACGDALYAMSLTYFANVGNSTHSANEGNAALGPFLKAVRMVARQQFMVRALKLKINALMAPQQQQQHSISQQAH